jgi:flagellar L-ring protein FlgH
MRELVRALKRIFAILAPLALFAGCGLLSMLKPPAPPPPAGENAAFRAAALLPAPSEGAIFQAGRERSFFEDPKAHHVGDVITIRLTEAFNASKTATTATGKDTSATFKQPLLGGRAPVGGDTSFANSQAFKGSGTSAQQNSLTGSITAVVTEVLPNGNLLVKGERALQLNQGEEYVRVAGVVRVTDLANDNSVTSDRIADARISYTGKGVADDANTMGWLARFFNSPYFPL